MTLFAFLFVVICFPRTFCFCWLVVVVLPGSVRQLTQCWRVAECWPVCPVNSAKQSCFLVFRFSLTSISGITLLCFTGFSLQSGTHAHFFFLFLAGTTTTTSDRSSIYQCLMIVVIISYTVIMSAGAETLNSCVCPARESMRNNEEAADDADGHSR